MDRPSLIIGTRGSDLALWQAHETARLLTQGTKLKIIKTSGDRFLDIPLQGRVDKGFFTKEIESQLIDGEIDLAVHSLKDLPTQQPPGLEIGAYLPRAPYSDVLLIHPDWYNPESEVPLKDGCETGATSLRRQCLLKCFAPHVKPTFLRGNVPNRVKKCIDGQYGAIILARAGIQRLNLDLGPLIVYELNPEIWLPAPGQGAIAIQIRQGDALLQAAAGSLDHGATNQAVTIERNLLARYEGGCHTAFGSLAVQDENGWTVYVGLEDEHGRWISTSFSGDFDSCVNLKPDDLTNFSEKSSSTVRSFCHEIHIQG